MGVGQCRQVAGRPFLFAHGPHVEPAPRTNAIIDRMNLSRSLDDTYLSARVPLSL